MSDERISVPVRNTLEVSRNENGEMYCIISQSIEFPQGATTYEIILSLPEMEQMITAYQSQISAAIAVIEVLEGGDSR